MGHPPLAYDHDSRPTADYAACLPREELNPWQNLRRRNPVVDGYWNACAYLNLIIPSP